MLSVKLKESTQEAHQALEAVVVRQIKSIRNKEQYVQLLHKFYGFHFPMEQSFDRYLNDEVVPLYSERRKANLVLKDLANLGSDTNVATSDSLPEVNSLAKALGAFYVLEGSTQGGSIVAGMLIKYAGMTPETTSFFNVYGEDKKKMWQSFKDKIDAYPADGTFHEEAIDAANATFTLFREWMLK